MYCWFGWRTINPLNYITLTRCIYTWLLFWFWFWFCFDFDFVLIWFVLIVVVVLWGWWLQKKKKQQQKTKKNLFVCCFYEDLNLKLYGSANRTMALLPKFSHRNMYVLLVPTVVFFSRPQIIVIFIHLPDVTHFLDTPPINNRNSTETFDEFIRRRFGFRIRKQTNK